jgi:hypothetical protein
VAEPLPGDYPLTLYRGDTRVLSLAFTEDDGTTAVDLSGKTWRAEVRETVDSAAVLLTWTVDDSDAATGILVLTLPATQWDDSDIPDTTPTTKWAWDLESTQSGVVRTWLKGKVKVLGDVSRAA